MSNASPRRRPARRPSWRIAAALLAATPLAAQAPSAPAGQITAIELVDLGSGQELRLRTSTSFERTAVQLFRDRGLVIQVPAHRPAPGVGPLEFGDGLVSAVDVEVDERGDAPATRLVVRTRGPMTQAVAAEGNLLRIRIRPAGVADTASAPPIEPTARTAAPPADRGLELATLEATLARSNEARSELAARLEGMAAEREATQQRLTLVEERLGTVEAELAATRSERDRLAREARELAQARDQARDESALAEGELRRRIDDLEAARATGERERQALAARLESGEVENARLVQALAERDDQLAETRAEIERLGAEVSGGDSALAAARGEIARLEQELAETTGELDRKRQKEFARLRLGELERDKRTLTAQLETARAELEAKESDARELAARLAEAEAAATEAERERDQMANLAASTAASGEETSSALESALDEAGVLRSRLATLEAELAAAQAEASRLEQTTDGETRRLAARVGELEGELQSERQARQAAERGLEAARADGVDGAQLAGDLEAAEQRTRDLTAQLETARRALIDSESRRRALEEAAGGAPLSPAPADTSAASDPAARTSTKVNMRSAPGTEFGIVALLPAGTPIEVLRSRGEWFEIRVGEETGWVHSDYLVVPGN